MKEKLEAQAWITAYINLMIYFLGISYYALHKDILTSFLIIFAVIPISSLGYKLIT